MSWVEQLKPDDDVKVEIIYPAPYVEHNLSTMSKFSEAAALFCRAAAVLEMDELEFPLPDITVAQIYSLEDVFRKYGIELTHEFTWDERSVRTALVVADISEFRERLENGENPLSNEKDGV